MRKCILLLLIFTIFTGCTPVKNNQEEKAPVAANDNEKIKGVWLFYREISMEKENGGTAELFEKKMSDIFESCLSYGINTVFFQVRPFADSFYPSKLFPWSKYLTGEQGKAVDYDPLKIAVKAAHKRKISLHAWINPFRISFSDDVNSLCGNNPFRKLFEEKSNSVCKTENGLYFNPSDSTAHSIIINGVKEIVNNYNVDGIHIDDYFYPVTDEDVDNNNYQAYKSKGGEMKLNNYRIQCINSFVSGLYNEIKSIKPSLIFSISPAGNIDNNYSALFADVIKWGNTQGYCDWLIPQLYYGFEDEALSYEKALTMWREKIKNPSVKLIAGIGAYKAAQGETEEWKKEDTVQRQIDYSQQKGYDGYAIFSYSNINQIKI